MLAVAFFPHRLNATRLGEATLSQELHTTRLLLLHVSVEYRWQHIGLSPVSRPNGYGCGFVSQPPRTVLATFIAHGSPASDSLLRSAFRISRTYPLELSYNLFPFVMSEALHLSIGLLWEFRRPEPRGW